MENKRFPEENGELFEELEVVPEVEVETEPEPQSIRLESIMEEDGSLNMDATLDMMLEDVEALLASENVTDETVIFPIVENEIAPAVTEEIPDMLYSDAYVQEEPQAAYDDSEFDYDYNYEEPAYDDGFRETEADEDFSDRFRNSAAQSVTIGESKPRPPRKGRPKRKKGYGFFGIPHLIATAIWLMIIVSIGVSLGRMLWLCAADVLAFGREDKPVTITIAATDTIEVIADKLHQNQLIRYPGLFKLYASIAVDEGEIATGTFTLNTMYDYHAIVNGMSSYSSFREVIEDVLIPEGYNCRQIFALLEEKGICSAADLEEYAANGEFQDFWFLEGIERGDKYCLEGYLFPDTYDFYAGSTPREALGKMLLGFQSRIEQEETLTKLAVLNDRLSTMMRNNGCSDSYIRENQLGVKDLIIVASLIEEETSSAAESRTIASVIYNRLTQDQVYERYLGIDATILYALGEHKEELTAEDLAIDSPYNTRIYAGLVPTPITNPGLNSLTAALDPEDTGYYYYVLNPATGTHQFSKTVEEHDKWRNEFAGVG